MRSTSLKHLCKIFEQLNPTPLAIASFAGQCYLLAFARYFSLPKKSRALIP